MIAVRCCSRAGWKNFRFYSYMQISPWRLCLANCLFRTQPGAFIAVCAWDLTTVGCNVSMVMRRISTSTGIKTNFAKHKVAFPGEMLRNHVE